MSGVCGRLLCKKTRPSKDHLKCLTASSNLGAPYQMLTIAVAVPPAYWRRKQGVGVPWAKPAAIQLQYVYLMRPPSMTALPAGQGGPGKLLSHSNCFTARKDSSIAGDQTTAVACPPCFTGKYPRTIS
jgi:hypothetical protein